MLMRVIITSMLYRSDIYSILVVFLNIALLSIPYTMGLTTPEYILAFIALSFLVFLSSIITHNFMHKKIFHRDSHNMLFRAMLVLARGMSVTSVKIAHQNHHKFIRVKGDWMGKELELPKYGLLRIPAYILKSIISVRLNKKKVSLTSEEKKLITIERIFLYLCISLLLYLDYAVFFSFTIPTWLLGQAGLVAVNLWQHDNVPVDPTNRNMSRDFTGKWLNLICLNNGLHSVHHKYPGAHWSKLPELHEDYVQRDDVDLIRERSLIAYVFRSYVMLSTNS